MKKINKTIKGPNFMNLISFVAKLSTTGLNLESTIQSI